MQILNLQASNVLNLDVIDITPTENTVMLSGRNGAGKTNVMRSIEFALSGKELKKTTEPVRRGQTSGDVVMTIGDPDSDNPDEAIMIVKRHFTNSSSSLEISNAKGKVFRSPQALLDKLRSNISFDPMDFTRLSEKQQKEVLLELIDLPIDLDVQDAKRIVLYSDRTLVNRDIKQLTGQMEGIIDRLNVPDEELSAADVMDEMKAATVQIATNDRGRELLRKHQHQSAMLLEKQEKLKAELETCTVDIDALKPEIDKISEEVENMVDPDLEVFKCKIEDVETINAHVRDKQERIRLLSKINDLRGDSLDLTVKMTAIDELKTETIKAANMPITGLGFDENGVTFGDIPLSQRSSGEQHKISMAIGMAMNPGLKVLWMKDASLLDSDSMDYVKSIAKEHGYQLWLELVSNNGNVGIVIKDGSIVQNNYT